VRRVGASGPRHAPEPESDAKSTPFREASVTSQSARLVIFRFSHYKAAEKKKVEQPRRAGCGCCGALRVWGDGGGSTAVCAPLNCVSVRRGGRAGRGELGAQGAVNFGDRLSGVQRQRHRERQWVQLGAARVHEQRGHAVAGARNDRLRRRRRPRLLLRTAAAGSEQLGRWPGFVGPRVNAGAARGADDGAGQKMEHQRRSGHDSRQMLKASGDVRVGACPRYHGPTIPSAFGLACVSQRMNNR